MKIFFLTISIFFFFESYSKNIELGAFIIGGGKLNKNIKAGVVHSGISFSKTNKKSFWEFNFAVSAGSLNEELQGDAICHIQAIKQYGYYSQGIEDTRSAYMSYNSYKAMSAGIGWYMNYFERYHKNKSLKSILYLGLSINSLLMKEQYNVIYTESSIKFYNRKEKQTKGAINFFILNITPRLLAYKLEINKRFIWRIEPLLNLYKPYDLEYKDRTYDYEDNPYMGFKPELRITFAIKM
ncbi:MAG: hypothetical protein J0M08_03860 [Bacteroidetes bacterium]|nr:hypothetical protein [Bacteroidota bacterium]